MAFNLNQVTLVGNCTRVDELRYTPGNTPVLKFSVATNRSVKDGDKYKDVATFHNIVVYGKIATWLAENITKGQALTITGRIDNYSYEKDGNRRYGSQVIANDVIPHKSKRADVEAEQQRAHEVAEAMNADPNAKDIADDIPF